MESSYTPSQADVKVFQQIKTPPAPEKYQYAWRWYNHILTFESEFSSLPGDPTKDHTAYGPESSDLTVNPAQAPAADDDDDVDLFGSDDEEEDAEAERIKQERLAEYNKKKAGKVKPPAKSIVTLDVKPWGEN
jgi:elongation factor 1-beta